MVIERRRPGAPARSDADPARPTNDNRSGAKAQPRGRGGAVGGSRPDLVFPGAVRWPATPERPNGAPTRRRRALAAAGCLAASAVLSAVAVASIAADQGRPATMPPRSILELADTRSRIVAGRRGAVLEFEGRIRNLSNEARDVPAVTVRVPGDPGFTRSFRPTASPLGPGRSLFFHSTLAVPSATTADGVGVVLAGADWRRP